MQFLKITYVIGLSDDKLFTSVVNQGIDSHLEAFTKSNFKQDGRRMVCNFEVSELPILTRRLRELETEEAESWADDIEASKEYRYAYATK